MMRIMGMSTSVKVTREGMALAAIFKRFRLRKIRLAFPLVNGGDSRACWRALDEDHLYPDFTHRTGPSARE